jgi:hypothetical protein
MRYTGHVARMEDMRKNTHFWLGDMCGKDRFAEVDLDESIILKCIFNKCDLMRYKSELMWLSDQWQAVGRTVMNLLFL